MRNFVAIAMVPATIGLTISSWKWNNLIVFASVYITGLVLLFMMQAIKPSFEPTESNYPEARRFFFNLPDASSQLKVLNLSPTCCKFCLKCLSKISGSTSICLGYAHPVPYTLVCCWNFIYELLFILCLFYTREILIQIILLLFGACSLLSPWSFLLSHIVPNTGSIVRYRSLYLPFAANPCFKGQNWLNLSQIYILNYKIYILF